LAGRSGPLSEAQIVRSGYGWVSLRLLRRTSYVSPDVSRGPAIQKFDISSFEDCCLPLTPRFVRTAPPRYPPAHPKIQTSETGYESIPHSAATDTNLAFEFSFRPREQRFRFFWGPCRSETDLFLPPLSLRDGLYAGNEPGMKLTLRTLLCFPEPPFLGLVHFFEGAGDGTVGGRSWSPKRCVLS